MLEIELKVKASSKAKVKQRLEELGARCIAKEEQVDIYFSHPSKDFGLTDEALRLRRAGNRAELTYKGRKLDRTTKTREELTTRINDFDEMREILLRLGFKSLPEVAKSREIYSLGEYLIMLDKVEGLGSYVEIEKEAQGYIEEELLGLAGSLGLSPGDVERRSYLELLMEAENEG